MLVRKKYLYDDIMQTLINTQNIKKRKLKNCIFEKKYYESDNWSLPL